MILSSQNPNLYTLNPKPCEAYLHDEAAVPEAVDKAPQVHLPDRLHAGLHVRGPDLVVLLKECTLAVHGTPDKSFQTLR